jgi:nitrogen fixation/metabolism regulation signal transduction histidine kinase
MKFSQFFQDGTGALSQMRLCMFLIVIAILSVFLFGNITNIMHAIRTKTAFIIVDFAPQMMIALGIVIGGKVFQSATGEK